MPKYAHIKGGKVVNVIDADVEFAAGWPTDDPEDMLVASDTARIGDSYDGQDFGLPTIRLAERKAAMFEQLERKAAAVEARGIVVNSVPVKTDPASQALISGAAAAFDNPGMGNAPHRLARGQWADLTPAQLKAIQQAVGQHVKATREAMRVHDEAIEAAADDTALDAIDIMAGWPS